MAMMKPGVYAPEGNARSAREILAKIDGEQAREMKRWADALERAQSQQDWAAVQAVASGLSATSVLLESFSESVLEALKVR